ncbi:hypothetical protein [Pendulispora albinea]|uniref:Outer membrane protein beta-barrel domain-containing protein n=1 Tax=Pendulispora albinea TaxID=2741071 RepID=A0ABZ2LRS2_9BACT
MYADPKPLEKRALPFSPGTFASFASFIAFVALLLLPSQAHAQRDLLSPSGGKGQLAIDSLMGFRIGSFSGVSYAGPLGFSTQSYNAHDVTNNNAEITQKRTTFWFAPSADYFIIDHLSIGGLIEIAATSGSVKTKTVAGGTTAENTRDLPTTTAFTLLPRVGYMIPLNSRFAVWPRGGIGYASRQDAVVSATDTGKDTFSSVIFAVDVPFLFRINETFFLSAAPELLFSLGGKHSIDIANTSRSADASFFQFGLVTGLGVLLDL